MRRHRHSDEVAVPVVPRKPIDGLTPAERDVLESVAQGLSDKETARLLGKCYYTVRCQVQAAVKKLGAENRPHAVALMLDPERFKSRTSG